MCERGWWGLRKRGRVRERFHVRDVLSHFSFLTLLTMTHIRARALTHAQGACDSIDLSPFDPALFLGGGEAGRNDFVGPDAGEAYGGEGWWEEDGDGGPSVGGLIFEDLWGEVGEADLPEP